jgi:hypothetical protein
MIYLKLRQAGHRVNHKRVGGFTRRRSRNFVDADGRKSPSRNDSGWSVLQKQIPFG